MVDFRPLLFINALALMLLVTAGFASVKEELIGTAGSIQQQSQKQSQEQSQQQPQLSEAIAAASKEDDSVFLEEEPTATGRPIQREVRQARTEPFSIGNLSEDPQPAPPAPAPKTGLLVLRSNVVGDQVSVNGRNYGATRLDLELEPGTYNVVIHKTGYQPWQRTVTLEAGDETTLVGQLEAFTNVDYRDGTWIGGVRTGDGTLHNSAGLRYEGHFVDGQFHGEGTAWYPDGSRYDGDWRAGQRHGEGNWRAADDTRYTGQFRNDNFRGHGSLTTSDGMLYVGGFRNGEFHGEGTLTYPDGRLYEGQFSNGEFHGKGKEVFANGKKYEGQYIEGSFHGRGLLSNPNGSSIQATFRYGEPYGQVRLTTAAGEIFTARTTEPGVCYRDKSYRATQCPTLEGW